MSSHPSSHPKINSAMEALSVNNKILLLALKPVGHDTPATDLVTIRPEGCKEDYQTGLVTGSKQLAQQFAMGQSYLVPDFNTRKTSGGGDLELADRAERPGKTSGSLFGRAAIFAKKWRIPGGPTGRGWVWMQLLKEEVGIWGDWNVRGITFDEECILGCAGGPDASLWDVAASYQVFVERREANRVAAAVYAEKVRIEREAKIAAISPLCKMAISHFDKALPVLGTLLPRAANVGLLLLEDKVDQAIEAYASIAEDLADMKVPEIKEQPLPEASTNLPKTSKSKPKPNKNKFDHSKGFKQILKLERAKNA